MEVLVKPLGARTSYPQILEKCVQNARIPGRAGSFAQISMVNERNMRLIRERTILTGILFIILCATVCAPVLAAQYESTANGVNAENSSALKRERASLVRSEATRVEAIQEIRPDIGVTVADIKELTRRSTDVIIGRPLGDIPFYDARNGETGTKRLVHVQVVMKGKLEI